ncbi:phytanoyl-CoA dioxygenase family protein [Streptomyces inhibens]|uniref:phytanoyl-CoA dioxygenase family protein n=1 Tax=Streptomyces inhibens TaxID=2293571 RepID=UPI0036A633F7
MGNILTQSQIRFYRENGYCVVEGIFDKGVLDKARRIWAPTARDRVFSELAEDSRLLDAISQLIGEDIVLQHSNLNVKPPQVGSVVDWHQEFAYYPHSNTDLVAALIYLDDATRENACLRVAAGSHRNGLLSHERDGCFGGRISSLENVGVDESTVVDCEGRAGTVVFLHPLVVHSSEKNLSDLYRRVFIPAYRAERGWRVATAHRRGRVQLALRDPGGARDQPRRRRSGVVRRSRPLPSPRTAAHPVTSERNHRAARHGLGRSPHRLPGPR